jgi:hypothetical protein
MTRTLIAAARVSNWKIASRPLKRRSLAARLLVSAPVRALLRNAISAM